MIRQKANARVSDAFLDLVKAFPLRPIRSERDHEAAIEVIRRLVGSKPEDQFTPDERDYLEALTILTHDYQQKRRHAELGPLGPGELVRHLMDENGMNVTDLGRVIGSRNSSKSALRRQIATRLP